MRIYVFVAGADPLRIFLHKDGLVRFATQEYKKVNNNNKEDVYVHLTNFAINKNHPNFLKSEDLDGIENRRSHKRSIEDFFNELREKGCKIDKAWNEVKKVIVKTLCSVQPILKHNYLAIQNDDPFNQGCFELLGFDILFDKKLKPYLLEVNHSPSFHTDSPVDLKVKSTILKDMFRMLRVDLKSKQKLMRMKRQQLQERTLTGRRKKMNEGLVRDVCLEKRDNFMYENKGGFERIFPPEGEENWEPYDQFLEQAEKLYKKSTGSEVHRVYKKSMISPINILEFSKRHISLEKIYGYKSKRYPSKTKKNKHKKNESELDSETLPLSNSGVKLQSINLKGEEDLDEIKEENKSKEGEDDVSKLKKSQPLLKIEKVLKKSFNKTTPVENLKQSEEEKEILKRLSHLPKVSPIRVSHNPEMRKLRNQDSTNSLLSVKKIGKRNNLRHTQNRNYDKYVFSPYIDNEPLLSINRVYKEKMRTFSIKNQKSRISN